MKAHVGFAPLFQSPGDKLSDAEVHERELRIAAMAPRVAG